MPFYPDVSTVRLCSLLESAAFALVFAVLWAGRRGEAYWLHWFASSALYTATLIVFGLVRPDAVVGGLLYACVAASTLLCLTGVHSFDGSRPFRPWMAAVMAAAGLGYALPVAFLDPGAALAPDAIARIGGTFGLATGMVMVGGILLLHRRATPSYGRRIAGFALLAYLPAYVLAIAAEFAGWSASGLAVLLPMMSDQVLLAVLNLGLLAMPGERAQAALRDMALRDALTGIWNRGGLAARTPRLLAADTAVVAIDVDHFKALNDRHGHAVGDRILIALAACADGRLTGIDDTLVRMGGDEFVVVLGTTSLPAALHFADGLRLALRRIPGLPAWSVSMGVAMVASTDASLAEGIARADRALYEAKAAGRDRSAA